MESIRNGYNHFSSMLCSQRREQLSFTSRVKCDLEDELENAIILIASDPHEKEEFT